MAAARPTSTTESLAHRRRGRRGAPHAITLASAVFALVVALSGCAGTASGDAGAGAPAITADSALLDPLYEGTFEAPPATGPKAPADKSVFIVSCGQAAIGCSAGVKGAVDAAAAIGWSSTVCDGAFGAEGAWPNCVRQGIAAHPDAIATFSIDCPAIKDALSEAKAAGVPVISFEGVDCDDPYYGAGEPLFAAAVSPSSALPTTAEFLVASGKMRAAYIVATQGNDAKVINFQFQGNALGNYVDEGFQAGMEECSGCTVYDVPFTVADFGDLRQMADSALLQYQDATAIAVPLENVVSAGVSQAVTASGRNGLLFVGGEGSPAGVEAVRAGGPENAFVATPQAWWGWAAIDTTNRVLAGESEPTVPQGLGAQIVDATHNLPSGGSSDYVGPIDFIAAYKAVWGVD